MSYPSNVLDLAVQKMILVEELRQVDRQIASCRANIDQLEAERRDDEQGEWDRLNTCDRFE